MKIGVAVVVLWLSLFLVGCASTHPGKMGTLLHEEEPTSIALSADKQNGFSDEHYTFVTFTVENKADSMVRIKTAELTFTDGNEKVASVIVGNDLITWAEAFEAGAKAREQRKAIARTALLVGGALLGITGVATDNNTLKLLGAGAGVAGASWSLGSSITNSVRDANNPSKVPENHLYAPFSVPAGLYMRRWAVLQKPVGTEIKKIKVSLTFDNDAESEYEVALD